MGIYNNKRILFSTKHIFRIILMLIFMFSIDVRLISIMRTHNPSTILLNTLRLPTKNVSAL